MCAQKRNHDGAAIFHLFLRKLGKLPEICTNTFMCALCVLRSFGLVDLWVHEALQPSPQRQALVEASFLLKPLWVAEKANKTRHAHTGSTGSRCGMFLHQTATHFSRAANENTISHSLLSLSPHTWPLEGSTVVVSSGRSTSPADSAPGSILKQPSPSLAERGVRAFLGKLTHCSIGWSK